MDIPCPVCGYVIFSDDIVQKPVCENPRTGFALKIKMGRAATPVFKIEINLENG